MPGSLATRLDVKLARGFISPSFQPALEFDNGSDGSFG
jgi:hypothetical protein